MTDVLERKRELEAEMLALRLAERRRELVPVTYAEEVVREVLEDVRTRLYWIPTEIQDANTARQVKEAITRALLKLEDYVATK